MDRTAIDRVGREEPLGNFTYARKLAGGREMDWAIGRIQFEHPPEEAVCQDAGILAHLPPRGITIPGDEPRFFAARPARPHASSCAIVDIGSPCPGLLAYNSQ